MTAYLNKIKKSRSILILSFPIALLSRSKLFYKSWEYPPLTVLHQTPFTNHITIHIPNLCLYYFLKMPSTVRISAFTETFDVELSPEQVRTMYAPEQVDLVSAKSSGSSFLFGKVRSFVKKHRLSLPHKSTKETTKEKGAKDACILAAQIFGNAEKWLEYEAEKSERCSRESITSF